MTVPIPTNATFTERLILSAFPVLTTHTSHNECSTQHQCATVEIFPHDVTLAALAVFYCRYTVYASGEWKLFRIVWASILAYLAYERYSYWVLACAHFLSFGEYTWNWIGEVMASSKVRSHIWNLKVVWVFLFFLPLGDSDDT